jgi:hypothetical protein
MHAIVRKDSKVEGSGDSRQVIVNRVRVTTYNSAKQSRVGIAEKPHNGGTRVVTVDGQKLDFDKNGAMVAGGIEDVGAAAAAAPAKPELVTTTATGAGGEGDKGKAGEGEKKEPPKN